MYVHTPVCHTKHLQKTIKHIAHICLSPWENTHTKQSIWVIDLYKWGQALAMFSLKWKCLIHCFCSLPFCRLLFLLSCKIKMPLIFCRNSFEIIIILQRVHNSFAVCPILEILNTHTPHNNIIFSVIDFAFIGKFGSIFVGWAYLP